MTSTYFCRDIIVEMTRVFRISEFGTEGGGVAMDVVPVDTPKPLVCLKYRKSVQRGCQPPSEVAESRIP